MSASGFGLQAYAKIDIDVPWFTDLPHAGAIMCTRRGEVGPPSLPVCDEFQKKNTAATTTAITSRRIINVDRILLLHFPEGHTKDFAALMVR
jgi:hypothetical protein